MFVKFILHNNIHFQAIVLFKELTINVQQHMYINGLTRNTLRIQDMIFLLYKCILGIQDYTWIL